MTVDREQIRRDADRAVDYRGINNTHAELGRHCLALLAELEQAEKERDLAREEVRLREESQIPVMPRAAADRLVNAEARLARVPALVEALKEVTAHAEASDYDRWNSRGISTDPGYGEPDEITKRALAVLAAWESE